VVSGGRLYLTRDTVQSSAAVPGTVSTTLRAFVVG
jgi:hypothetical protein